MESNIAVQVEHLTKIYPIYDDKKDRMKEALSITRKKYHKEFRALNDISFQIHKGETLGIIGQNGSGKSTLLKILTGVLTQTEGTVQIEGKVSALLELGAGFNVEMTGMENIYLNGTIMGYTKEEMDEKVPLITGFADIGEFIDQPVKMYSSGMFARLAFAVAINVEPDILIVDEALSVGDMFFQNKCFAKIEEFRKKGITTIFVSHDISSVKQLCNKVLWIDKGDRIDYGDKQEICEKYLSHQIKLKNSIKTVDEASDKITKMTYVNTQTTFPNNAQPNTSDLVSEDVEILSFFIKDKTGEITNNLETLEEYTFHIVAKSHKNIDNAIFGFMMENRKGIPIVGINTFIGSQERQIKMEANQVVESVFRLRLPKLLKDEYLLSPAIATGIQDNHKTLTWLHNREVVTIDNNGYNMTIIEIDAQIDINVYKENKIQLV